MARRPKDKAAATTATPARARPYTSSVRGRGAAAAAAGGSTSTRRSVVTSSMTRTTRNATAIAAASGTLGASAAELAASGHRHMVVFPGPDLDFHSDSYLDTSDSDQEVESAAPILDPNHPPPPTPSSPPLPPLPPTRQEPRTRRRRQPLQQQVQQGQQDTTAEVTSEVPHPDAEATEPTSSAAAQSPPQSEPEHEVHNVSPPETPLSPPEGVASPHLDLQPGHLFEPQAVETSLHELEFEQEHPLHHHHHHSNHHLAFDFDPEPVPTATQEMTDTSMASDYGESDRETMDQEFGLDTIEARHQTELVPEGAGIPKGRPHSRRPFMDGTTVVSMHDVMLSKGKGRRRESTVSLQEDYSDIDLEHRRVQQRQEREDRLRQYHEQERQGKMREQERYLAFRTVNPLDLPEIRTMVGKYLPRKALRNCMLVCTGWWESFVPFLWANLLPVYHNVLGQGHDYPSAKLMRKHSHLIKAFEYNGHGTVLWSLIPINLGYSSLYVNEEIEWRQTAEERAEEEGWGFVDEDAGVDEEDEREGRRDTYADETLSEFEARIEMRRIARESAAFQRQGIKEANRAQNEASKILNDEQDYRSRICEKLERLILTDKRFSRERGCYYKNWTRLIQQCETSLKALELRYAIRSFEAYREAFTLVMALPNLQELVLTDNMIENSKVVMFLEKFCVRLTKLELKGVRLDMMQFPPELMEEGRAFKLEKMKSLSLVQVLGTSNTFLLEWIKRCPNLGELVFRPSMNIKAKELAEVLSERLLDLTDLNYKGMTMSDLDASLLIKSTRSLEKLELSGSVFGLMATNNLLARHHSRIQFLDIRTCSYVPSSMVQRILGECRYLKVFRADGMQARDIAQNSVYSTWACLGLRELVLDIRGDPRERGMARKVYQQLSQLVCLESLDISRSNVVPPPMPGMLSRTGLGFDLGGPDSKNNLTLGLDSGLMELRTLVHMSRFVFRGIEHEFGLTELKWVAKAWPLLEHIGGRLREKKGSRFNPRITVPPAVSEPSPKVVVRSGVDGKEQGEEGDVPAVGPSTWQSRSGLRQDGEDQQPPQVGDYGSNSSSGSVSDASSVSAHTRTSITAVGVGGGSMSTTSAMDIDEPVSNSAAAAAATGSVTGATTTTTGETVTVAPEATVRTSSMADLLQLLASTSSAPPTLPIGTDSTASHEPVPAPVVAATAAVAATATTTTTTTTTPKIERKPRRVTPNLMAIELRRLGLHHRIQVVYHPEDKVSAEERRRTKYLFGESSDDETDRLRAGQVDPRYRNDFRDWM